MKKITKNPNMRPNLFILLPLTVIIILIAVIYLAMVVNQLQAQTSLIASSVSSGFCRLALD